MHSQRPEVKNVHQMNKRGATLLNEYYFHPANESWVPVLSAPRNNYTEKLGPLQAVRFKYRLDYVQEKPNERS